MKRNSLKNSLFFFLFFLFAFWTGELTAQKHIAIDNKGTLKDITSSQVSTTAGVTPLNPNEGDVWIDTASNTVKIWEESAVPAWREVASIRNWISLSNSGVYGIDHLVSYNGSIYKNLTGTNSDTTPNLDVTNWKSIGGGDIVPLWKSTTSGGSYVTNDIINYNGTLYKNLTGTNTDTTPDLDTTNWINLEQITKVSGEFIREGDLIKAVGLESVTGGTVVFVEGTDPTLSNIELAFDGDNETVANLYISSFSRHNYELPSVLNVSKLELNYSSPADSSNVIIRLLDATDTILEEITPPELLASQGTVKLKYEMNVSGVAKVQIFDPTGSRTNINEISLYTLENSLAIPNVDIGDTLYLEDYGYTTLLSNLDGNVTLRATTLNEVPRWVSNTNGGTYNTESIINYQGTLYKNTTGTNTDTAPDADTTNWSTISGGGDIVPLWKSDTNGGVYTVNDVINYGGTLYKNLTGTNSDTTPDLDVTNWEQTTFDVINSLTSTSTTDALSANEGRILNNLIQALDVLPESQRNIAYVQLSQTLDIVYAAANAPEPIHFNTEEERLGITHSTSLNNAELTIQTSAIYTIIAQPQVFSGTNNGVFRMWLQRDQGAGFVNVPNSNVELHLSNNGEDVIIFTSVMFLAKDDKIRMMGVVNNTAVILKATAPVGEPLVPAAILAMFANSTGVNIQKEVLGIVDSSIAPPTSNVDDLYVLTNIGSINASWGSIANLEEGDVVVYTGTNWEVALDASTQFTKGEYQVYNDADDKIYYFDNTEWIVLGSDASDIVPLWKSNTDGGSYATNDIINYNGNLYKNLTGTNTDTTPDADATNWQTEGASGGLAKQYLVAKHSGGAFSVTNGMTYPYNTTVASEGDNIINNTDGTYTLKAGNTYKLTANIGRFSGTGYVAWKWYNGTDNAYIDTGSSAQQWGTNYTDGYSDGGTAFAIVRPEVDTTVYLRQTSGTGTASMDTEGTYGTARMYIEVLETSSIGGTGLATYDINRDYQLNDSIEKDGIIYKANGTIPAGTTFSIGTTGATWTALTTAAVLGTKYQYLVAKYSGSAFSITNGMTYPYNTTLESEGTSISQSGGVFTLKAGNTYKLTADIGRFSGTGYVSWKWYNGTTNSYIDTSSSADQWGGNYSPANNTWTDSGTAHAMITPDVDTEVYLRQNSGTTTATQNTEGSFGTARVFVELLSTPVNKNLTDTNEVATDETYDGKIVYRKHISGTTSADGSGVVLLNNISWLVRSEGRVSRAVGAFQQWHDISLVKTLNPDVHVDPVFYSEGPNDIRLLIGSGTEYHSRPYKLTLWYTKL